MQTPRERQHVAAVSSTDPVEVGDEKLVADVRAGSETAFGELVRRHQIAVFRLLLGFVGNGDDAERLCERLFVEAARRIDELPPEGTFQEWLVRLTREVVKKDEAQRPSTAVRSKPRPVRDVKTLVKREVQQVLAQLTSDERLSLVLADLEGDSYEVIAQTLGTSSDEARSLVASARSKFIEAMDQDAARKTAEASELKQGQVLDTRFRIGDMLGKGGMGAVYRATDERTGRPVALKVLLPAAAQDPTLRRRFAREAELIQRLQHPNFVRFVHHGEAPGEPAYVVMELLEGLGLDALIEQAKRLDPVRALHLTQKLLHGLGYAHGQGVVHRDLKPENVLLVEHETDREFPKILDLGIAKLLGADAVAKTGITERGELFGTPLYISPELLRGDELDGRADLYALTVMLYQMLTSRPPFYSSNSLGVFAMHLATPPPTLASSAPELKAPPALEQLLAKGMAKEPNERISSADEYLRAIDELLLGEWAGLPLSDLPRVSSSAVTRRVAVPTPSAKAATPAPRQIPRRTATPGLWFRLRTSRSARFGVVLLALALAGLAYLAARQLSLVSFSPDDQRHHSPAPGTTDPSSHSAGGSLVWTRRRTEAGDSRRLAVDRLSRRQHAAPFR